MSRSTTVHAIKPNGHIATLIVRGWTNEEVQQMKADAYREGYEARDRSEQCVAYLRGLIVGIIGSAVFVVAVGFAQRAAPGGTP